MERHFPAVQLNKGYGHCHGGTPCVVAGLVVRSSDWLGNAVPYNPIINRSIGVMVEGEACPEL